MLKLEIFLKTLQKSKMCDIIKWIIIQSLFCGITYKFTQKGERKCWIQKFLLLTTMPIYVSF